MSLCWLVFPLLVLATLASPIGPVILPADVVAAVVVDSVYVEVAVDSVYVAGGVMVAGLGAEWLLRR